DEVGLAVDLDERAELGAGVDVGVHEAVLGVAALTLLGVGQPLLAQELDGGVEVAIAGLQGRLAIHDASARAVAQLHHRLGVGRHQDTSASAVTSAISAPSVSASAS